MLHCFFLLGFPTETNVSNPMEDQIDHVCYADRLLSDVSELRSLSVFARSETLTHQTTFFVEIIYR